MERIIKTYKITYHNGFKQVKRLISSNDYDYILRPIQKAISIIEDSNKGKANKQSNSLKESLAIMFGYDCGSCFKLASPLGESIKTGILSLTENQGGNHKISWEELKQPKQ